jgi:hypothetical protein
VTPGTLSSNPEVSRDDDKRLIFSRYVKPRSDISWICQA